MAQIGSMLLIGLHNCCTLSVTATSGGFVYEIVDTKRSWADAEADCVTRGGHLASVKSEDEIDFLSVYVSDEYNCGGR